MAAGFSLAENLFAALIMATVIMGMSEILTSYTLNHARAGDVLFAVDIAQSQLDQVEAKLMTQNSLAFDKKGKGATYDMEARDLESGTGAQDFTVTQYFFNNFYQEVGGTLVPLGWPPASLGSTWNEYFTGTLFVQNRYYDDGGNLNDAGAGADYAWLQGQLGNSSANPDPPHFAVRLQLFGVPFDEEGESILANVSNYLACGDTYTDDGTVPTTPPSTCKQLIADSCANTIGTPCTGEMWINNNGGNPAGESASNPYSPYFFDHYTVKILVAKVYRATDLLNDKTFYNTTTDKFAMPLASASVILDGRLILK